MRILEKKQTDTDLVPVYLAACHFFLGEYTEADTLARKAPSCKLLTRLRFHLAHVMGDEAGVLEQHQQLEDVLEDQLSLASIHYLRQHYQESIDIYKHLLIDDSSLLALNVYVAMCYYKLEYYDMSQELLSVYLNQDPTSFTAVNLKACNYYRLFNNQAAEKELSTFTEKASADFSFGIDILNHNMAVFRGGMGAVQVFTPLVDVLPEARFNLALYHLKHNDIDAAYALLDSFEPSTSAEYILKAVTLVQYGQHYNSAQPLLDAKDYFQFVGVSPIDRDTILGRQAMASVMMLTQKYKESLVYFDSIKSYMESNDAFNFNYAQVLVKMGDFEGAEACLIAVQNEKYQQEYTYIGHLARCCKTMLSIYLTLSYHEPEATICMGNVHTHGNLQRVVHVASSYCR